MLRRRHIPGPLIRATFVTLTIAAMAAWLWALGTGIAWILDNLTAI